MFSTGAGLEPATSGVTVHFAPPNVDDDQYAIALLMRNFGTLGAAAGSLLRTRLGRLLPCVPDQLAMLAATLVATRSAGVCICSRIHL
jgi:hypothetical protein